MGAAVKITASIPMTKAQIDNLTDADLRWLEAEFSRRLAEEFYRSIEAEKVVGNG